MGLTLRAAALLEQDMNPPTHLTKLPPEHTFDYIASWARNAADIYRELASLYDEEGTEAVRLRHMLIECSAHIWAAIVLGQGDARWRLARGLDVAQRIIGPVDFS